jgi:hypothetical protein
MQHRSELIRWRHAHMDLRKWRFQEYGQALEEFVLE